MAQPTAAEANGILTPASEPGHHLATPSKRKRGDKDGANAADGDTAHQDDVASRTPAARTQKKFIRAYFDVLASLDAGSAIVSRPLADANMAGDEPEAKRKKPVEVKATFSIRDKVAVDAYAQIKDIARDALQAADAALTELSRDRAPGRDEAILAETNRQIRTFRERALDLVQGEIAYPKVPAGRFVGNTDARDADRSPPVLAVTGYAPKEKRLFSSLPRSRDVDMPDVEQPPGVSITHIVPLKPNKKARSLGETFASLRPLAPIPPPKQSKPATRGKVLDLYHPELVDTNKYRANCFYTTKLTAGHYLDYSKATPPSQTRSRLHERAQGLSEPPSAHEREVMELESLFRGAFSSFAPCKDDTSAIVPSSVAGRVWWHQLGQRNFQKRIEAQYYAAGKAADPLGQDTAMLDEEALQEAIDERDESAVDPSLASIMGARDDVREREVDEVLDEISDLIQTLASYQRIRNLSLPPSQNRQPAEPVRGDMPATDLPAPSEEEQATYGVLKAQLALIIQTLPPYAVAKLNGDQLEDLLISTKLQVQTVEYQGTMEEDDTAVQARLRAQQQAQQQAVGARTAGQRPANTPTAYAGGQFAPGNPHGMPSRPPAPGQHYRPGFTPNHAPWAMMPLQQHPPSARPPQQPAALAGHFAHRQQQQNGHPSQYATQLAKAQTPYGHQNVPQHANQPPRPAAAGAPQHHHPPPPHARYSSTPKSYAQPATYANGSPSPSVLPPRHSYSPSPAAQQQAAGPRYYTPGRYGTTAGHQQQQQPLPGPTGYRTVISEAQQQRILDQAKAHVAAQERSGMFGGGGGARAGAANGTPTLVPPHKVTPVPVPVIPGAAGSSQQQSSPRRSESAS